MNIYLRGMAAVFALFVVSMIAACGGGGGGTATTNTANNPVSYVSSAALGEVIIFNVQWDTLTYSYEVVESRFGCSSPTSACRTGSGTLARQSDGTYQPSGSPTTRLLLADNGLLVGTFKLSATVPVAPVLGFSSTRLISTFTPTDVLFAGVACPARTDTNLQACKTVWGNLVTTGTTDNATFNLCRRGTVGTCSVSDLFSGTVEYSGKNGVWRLKVGTDIFANMILTKSTSNGPTIGFVDFDSSTFGYGHAKVATRVSLTTELIAEQGAGTWILANELGQTAQIKIDRSGNLSTGNIVTLNDPTSGLAKITGDSDGPYASLQTGNGMFAIINNLNGTESFSSKYFIGIKISNIF